jgi:zinc transport system permease protein
MNEFISAVAEHAFLRNALFTGLLASVACGVVGSYVVVRRITYMAAGIAHCVLGGIGAAVYLERVHGWQGLDPLHGAVAAALLAALVIGFVSLRARERVDTAIGAVWAIGMAAGVLFLSKTPGYGEDLMGYLFGNVLMVSSRDLWLVAGLDAVILAVGIAFYNRLLAVSFDAEHARARGLNVEFYFLLLLVLTALTVVLLVTVVGIVLVIALLTIPAAIAGRFSARLSQMMALAVVVSAALTVGGLGLSFAADVPAGATIILLAGAAYIVTLTATRLARDRRTRARGTRDLKSSAGAITG